MVASNKIFTWGVAAAVLLAAGVDAHGHLGLPAVTFPDGVDPTQFVATIEASASGFLGSFNGGPGDNTAAFTTAFNASDYASLKDFVTDLGQIVAGGANIECGLTDPNEMPQPLPETYIEWTHSDTEGFTASHEGPCEAWCDDTRVFQDEDCAAHFTTAPAQMPFDRDTCSGAGRLTFYWLALHSSTWQVYINCAALEASSGDQINNLSNPSAGTKSTTTATPSVTPTAPSSGTAVTSDEDDCEELDIAGDDTGDVTGEAAAPGGEAEEDCEELDIAGSEDCDELEIAGEEAATPVSEASVNFSNINGDYTGGKVYPDQSS